MNDPIQLTNAIPSIRNLIGRLPLRRGLPPKEPRKLSGLRTRAMWIMRGFFLITLALACFGLSPQTRAACQQGCDIAHNNTFLGNGALAANTSGSANTASGDSALLQNTTGVGNTADGASALFSNTTGSANTATGATTLVNNTSGSFNTANGNQALALNTTGSNNTAIGLQALLSNTTGNNNTASGYRALFNNTTGSNNTANGFLALINNTTGNYNTASGLQALLNNTTGIDNTASGSNALNANVNGHYNTADGFDALLNNTSGAQNMAAGVNALLANTTGGNNTASGVNALLKNTTGSSNTALGHSAGSALTTGSNNIDIGNIGVAAESNTIRIGTTQVGAYMSGISGRVVPAGVSVIVGANGKLGTVVSSARFKEDIKPMEQASESILSLKPVTFHYKQELDPAGIAQFGLVAEEVEKVNPNLVARDEEGKVYTVRYEAVNAMLLNEFIKEHRKGEQQDRKIEELEATVAKLQSAFKEQASQIQEVSDRLEVRQPARQVVASDRIRKEVSR